MIGVFPAPYPDELLYSLCARYSDAMQYPNKTAVHKDLFGNSGAANVSLPYRLGHFVTQLPPNCIYTVERIIQKHTLLPFYAPFMSNSRANAIKAGMKGSNYRKVLSNSGIGAFNIQTPRWLRFCSVCAEEDKKHWGEYYWHRLHQLPGVNVCTEHDTFLIDSGVFARDRPDDTEYVSAERSIMLIKPLQLNSSTVHSTLLEIARDASWLLCNCYSSPGIELLHSCYLNLMASRNLIRSSGRRRNLALARELNKFYKPSLLKILQCEVDEQKDSVWVRNILNNLVQDELNHPLRHLLLIRFFGHTAESFFDGYIKEVKATLNTRKASHPFGNGPYPCLNPVCEHFQQMIITKLRTSRQNHVFLTNGSHPLLGTFNCVCGFTYARREADLFKLGPFEFSFVKAYGHVWETTLIKLWGDKMTSLRRVASLLGTNNHNIKRRAIHLGLTFPRLTTRVYVQRGKMKFSTILNPKILSDLKRRSARRTEKRTTNRKAWLTILRSVSNITHHWLRQNRFYGTYLWLLKHDKEWLSAHMPETYKTRGSRRKVDWSERDRLTVEEVRSAIIRLNNAIGHPKRITRKAIAIAIGGKGRLSNYNLSKFPLTAKLLSEIIETRNQFALRCLYWAAQCFRQENVAPTRTRLICRLGGERAIWHDHSLKAIFESVWQSLHKDQAQLDVEAA